VTSASSRRRWIGHGTRQKGQALVEFALLLPPLLLLVLGGTALYELVRVQTVVEMAATEAARAAAATRSPVDGDIQATLSRAQASATDQAHLVLAEAGLQSDWNRVSVDADFGNSQSEDTVLVNVTVACLHQLSPVSRTILKPWFPDGLVHLEGHAHEALPRYVSSLP